jgi:hypothetical protein
VDTKTLEGKIMAGYQGWFNTQEYGAGLGWTHWARSGSQPFGSGYVTIDPPVNFLFLHSRPACRWIPPTRLKRKSLAFKTS